MYPELTPLAETTYYCRRSLNDLTENYPLIWNELTFDEGEFYETERRLDLINGLKAKYGRTIEENFQHIAKLQEEKLEKLHKYEEKFTGIKGASQRTGKYS